MTGSGQTDGSDQVVSVNKDGGAKQVSVREVSETAFQVVDRQIQCAGMGFVSGGQRAEKVGDEIRVVQDCVKRCAYLMRKCVLLRHEQRQHVARGQRRDGLVAGKGVLCQLSPHVESGHSQLLGQERDEAAGRRPTRRLSLSLTLSELREERFLIVAVISGLCESLPHIVQSG